MKPNYMTQTLFTELVRNETGFDTVAEYVEYLKQLEKDNADSGRVATAMDYRVAAQITQRLFDNLPEL